MTTTDHEAQVPALIEIDDQLTSQQACDRIATAITAAAFAFEQDDLMTIATASELTVTDATEYQRGYELLEELGALATRIASSYTRFDKPLLFLTKHVRALKSPQVSEVETVKKALALRLGAWKAERDR